MGGVQPPLSAHRARPPPDPPVVAACSPTQLLLWGWRVPFLLVTLSASLALLLRLNMPEPLELIAGAQLALAEEEGGSGGAAAGKGVAAAAGAAEEGKRQPAAVAAGQDKAAVDAALAKLKHRVPLAELLRHHLPALLLMALIACYAQASVCEYGVGGGGWGVGGGGWGVGGHFRIETACMKPTPGLNPTQQTPCHRGCQST
jgi:hypothetical protein